MTNKTEPSVPVTFLDNPHAPEMYVDGCCGAAFMGGNLRLTFESARVNHETSPGPVMRVVVGRLVMSLGAAEVLRSLLNSYLPTLTGPGAAPSSQGQTIQ